MLGWVIFFAFVTFLGIAVLFYRRDQERETRRKEMSAMLGVRPKWAGHPHPTNDTKPAPIPAQAAEPFRPPAEREMPILFKLLEMEARDAQKGVATNMVQTDTATIIVRGSGTPSDTRSVKRYEREYEVAVTVPPHKKCTLRIDYVDAIGVCTTRLIAPYKSGNTNLKFDAWCATRQARRTFFFERIQSAVNVSTGTRMNRADVFRHIHPGRRVPRDLL